ncbi:elongation factor Ts [Aerococcus urinaehominis]|uniref:Elongation factor Ts n=1 Tax=Aerococcus urinaehominis TaxID=128944 RepID=A0A0X8FK87_9LACT|nr:translation elongation factor Ts [Aerococcus urinaehominis]AMB98834.1 elongation factor Ts [Aerococcus urinaehominis]SDM17836.1 elongation factor Ts [Aerococcus urinaehominis]
MAVTAKEVKELRDRTGVGMMDAKKALVETDGDMDKAIDFLRENGLAKAAKKSDRIAAEGLTKVVVRGNEAVILELNSETDFVAKNEQFINLLDSLAFAILDQKPESVEAAMENVTIEGQKLSEHIAEKTSVIGEKLDFRRFEIFTKTDDQEFGHYAHQGGRISVLVQLTGGDQDLANGIAMHIGGLNPRFLDEESVPADVREHEKEVLTEQALNEGKPANIVEKMIAGRLRKFFSEICLVDQDYLLDDSKTVGEVAKEAGAKIDFFRRYEVGEGIEKREENFADEVAQQMK